MQVSIIIATKNEEDNIAKCLNSLAQQDFPQDNFEIIIVDNNSTDKTKQIIDGFSKKLTSLNLKIFNRDPERSAQRNFGVEKSSGKYFLYLDADMQLGKDTIRECAEKMEKSPELIALYIPETIMGEKFFSRVRRFERKFYDGTAIDAVRFIKKDKFLEAGEFDEKLYAGEDWDLDKRLAKLGKFDVVKSPLFHDESEFTLAKYINKKKYYSKNLDAYIAKWGKDDPDIKKQLGLFYRYFGVFTENGKWKKLLRHPILTFSMYFLRFLVGVKFLTR
jgi:glycosyltransferase involved in cell wall biosynthesis